MKPDKPALIILTPGFPANEADTTCLPMQQALVRSINRQYPGLRIIVITFQYPFFKKYYHWHGIEIFAFNGRNKGGISRLFLWRMILKKLKQLHDETDITGVFSFWCGECSLINKWFSRRHGIRHYYWILGQDARNKNRYISRIKPRPEELIALSDSLKAEFNKNHHIDPAFVIIPGVEIPRQQPSAISRDIDILGAGSLIPLKQYDIFIDIIYEIEKRMPGIRAMICGKGPEEGKLLARISDLQLENVLSLKGELSHPGLLKMMQRTKLLLHPSAFEGFSGVCLEALQAGAHVISFCQPMVHPISHWHTVNSKEELIEKAIKLLNAQRPDYSPVIYNSIDGTARKIMELFSH